MCRALNKLQAGVPSNAVYIGRGSKRGNPFRIGPMATAPLSSRSTSVGCAISIICCECSMSSADLVCFCAPRACHGGLLLWLANATRVQRVAWWHGLIIRIPSACV